ncbi:caspase family protein [Variovorax sp. dw_954]|uniref:caspase family protein n=1 Tax=Variovorax sp. dw_954 TaxID=2720078 RepID=UPI001BD292D2|nr:caspase family protein [Variovorax sp. dw_954]
MRAAATKLATLALAVVLAGCANQSMPGYQRVYQGYQVPQELVGAVQKRLRAEGLRQALVSRDSVGRLRLAGSYRDEEEVERAFIITQSIVGIQSTSPFYPENVQEKRWEREAGTALADFYKRKKQIQANAPGKKRALVIGINKFLSPKISAIQGEDDASVMGMALAAYGYDVISLLGGRATKANIESAISELDRALGPNDTLFIYISSHGTQPVPTPSGNDERRMSIIAYDTGSADPKAPAADATSYALRLQNTSVRDTLVQNLAQRPTAVTRVIIDTCYSGEILKDLPSAGAAYQRSVNGGGYEKSSVSEASWTGASFTSKAIAVVEDDKRNAPVQTGRKSDFATRKNYSFITATGPGEQSYGPPTGVGTFSLEANQSETLRGSYFTQSFLAFLKQYSGDVPRAFEDSRAFTAKTVLQVTKGLPQNPRRFTTIPAEVDNLAKF